jgi:alpha-L-fucosidase
VGGRYEDYRTPEQEVPERPLSYVWESCITMGKQWSYKPGDAYKSTRELIQLLVDVVAKGGNLLLNVGPQPDGALPPEAVTRMAEIGAWMAVNAEAIHGSRPRAPYKEGRVAFTRKGDVVYAIDLPEEGRNAPAAKLVIAGVRPRAGSEVRLLGAGSVPWSLGEGGLVIEVPESMRSTPPCSHAFVFRIEADLP